MKKINCIILEDEYLARLKLIEYVNKRKELNLIGAFATVSQVIKSNLIEHCKLYFLDINLSGTSGLEFAKVINMDSLIVFTTAYSEYAVDGFNLNAIDYLLKPYDYKRFEIAVQKIQNQLLLLEKSNNYILLKQGREIIRCNLNEVNYIKGMQEYLYWKLEDTKIITLGSMANYATELKAHKFIRIHKSYIVNLKKVDSISTKKAIINNEEIPIGRTYVKEFRKVFASMA